MKNILYSELKKFLVLNGLTIKWWVNKHLRHLTYSAAMSQLNNQNPMDQKTIKVIKKFLYEKSTSSKSGE